MSPIASCPAIDADLYTSGCLCPPDRTHLRHACVYGLRIWVRHGARWWKSSARSLHKATRVLSQCSTWDEAVTALGLVPWEWRACEHWRLEDE